jgi:hypothetical protein
MTPAFNRIRWDFAYAADGLEADLYMIHPEFLDAAGEPVPSEDPLPVGVELSARMRVVVEEMRMLHRVRIAPGVRFFCHEGNRRVADGVVVRVTGLFDE